MASNSTQPCHSPSDVPSMNIEHEFGILSMVIVNDPTTSQPSTIHFNPTDMIPSTTHPDHRVRHNPVTETRPVLEEPEITEADIRVSQHDQRQHLHTAQQRLDQDRQRFAQAQRRINQEEQRINQEQRRIRRERQRLNEERNLPERRRRQRRQNELLRLHPERHHARLGNPPSLRDRQPRYYHYPEMIPEIEYPDPTQDEIDAENNETLLEAYDNETMDTRGRQELWEQEHLREMQGLSRPDSLERYAVDQHEQESRDEVQQDINITHMQRDDQRDQSERNREQLADKEEWEDISFRLQQQP